LTSSAPWTFRTAFATRSACRWSDLLAQEDRLQVEAAFGHDGLAAVEPSKDLGPLLAPLADLDRALLERLSAGLHEDHALSRRVLDGGQGNREGLSLFLDGNPHVREHLELQPAVGIRDHASHLGGAGGRIEEVAHVSDVAAEDLARVGGDGDEALSARLHAPDVFLVKVRQHPDVRSVDEGEKRLVPIDQLTRGDVVPDDDSAEGRRQHVVRSRPVRRFVRRGLEVGDVPVSEPEAVELLFDARDLRLLAPDGRRRLLVLRLPHFELLPRDGFDFEKRERAGALQDLPGHLALGLELLEARPEVEVLADEVPELDVVVAHERLALANPVAQVHVDRVDDPPAEGGDVRVAGLVGGNDAGRRHHPLELPLLRRSGLEADVGLRLLRHFDEPFAFVLVKLVRDGSAAAGGQKRSGNEKDSHPKLHDCSFPRARSRAYRATLSSRTARL